MWDVWFDSQIVCSKVEHLSNIDEIALQIVLLLISMLKGLLDRNSLWLSKVLEKSTWRYDGFSFFF